MRYLIAVDWGTSTLRGALMAGDGTVLEELSAPDGILSVPAGGFEAVFAKHFGRWQQTTGALALIAGMAGSRQGWQEAAYCPCPAGFADVAARLHWIAPARVALVPGLSCEDQGVPDVMRGEEIQVFGALDLLGLDEALLVLPGTHSKWVTVEDRRVVGFRTFMTGEIYALLRHHSILARTLPATDGELDTNSFRRGLAHAAASVSLLHAAFSVRTLALFERLPSACLPSYLSGVVIGEEFRAQDLFGSVESVVLIGAPALTARYRLALESLGIGATTVGSQASWRGLWAIARQLEQFK